LTKDIYTIPSRLQANNYSTPHSNLEENLVEEYLIA